MVYLIFFFEIDNINFQHVNEKKKLILNKYFLKKINLKLNYKNNKNNKMI
jgi:hypothetical protein